MTNLSNSHSLIDADDSVLIAVDVQDAFLDKLPSREREQLLNRICWLVSVAEWRQIPLVVTAEDHHAQPLAANLIHTLPTNTQVFDKTVFGLAHQADIRAAVAQTGRRTAVLVGLETDVCVAQSALGLLDLGYRVAVVTDAIGTPPSGQEIGLNRMQSAGVFIVNMKSLFYEWLRTLDAVRQFHRECPGMRSLAGIEL